MEKNSWQSGTMTAGTSLNLHSAAVSPEFRTDMKYSIMDKLYSLIIIRQKIGTECTREQFICMDIPMERCAVTSAEPL